MSGCQVACRRLGDAAFAESVFGSRRPAYEGQILGSVTPIRIGGGPKRVRGVDALFRRGCGVFRGLISVPERISYRSIEYQQI